MMPSVSQGGVGTSATETESLAKSRNRHGAGEMAGRGVAARTDFDGRGEPLGDESRNSP